MPDRSVGGDVDHLNVHALVLAPALGRRVVCHEIGGRCEVHHDLERRDAARHQVRPGRERTA